MTVKTDYDKDKREIEELRLRFLPYYMEMCIRDRVMYVPTPIIGRNLQVLAEELHLGATEMCIRDSA